MARAGARGALDAASRVPLRLNLSKNALQIEDVQALAASVPASLLASVSLGGNTDLALMTSSEWGALFSGGVAKLDVRSCGLRDGGVRALVPVLTVCKKLVTVNVRCNGMTIDGLRDMMICTRYTHVVKVLASALVHGSVRGCVVVR